MTPVTNPKSWLVCLRPCTHPRLQLVCFPSGGGGAAAFWPWRAELSPDVELWALRLPGRESRIAEPFVDDAATAVRCISAELARITRAPMVLYGHSLGAALAFQTIDARRGGPLPSLLIASGRMPPHVPYPGAFSRVSDDELAAHLVRLGGAAPELFADRTFASVFLPRIRADFALNETLAYRRFDPIDVPITVINGAADPLIDAARVDEWRDYTTVRFESHRMEGGHFFVQSELRDFLALVNDQLERAGT